MSQQIISSTGDLKFTWNKDVCVINIDQIGKSVN
jgi:hypothetical protein